MKNLEDNLTAALSKLDLASGKEEEELDKEEDNPSFYLDKVLAVADACYELEQCKKAGGLYCGVCYATMHRTNAASDPTIFPIAHKMITAQMKTNLEHYINHAHGIAQQNYAMPGHLACIREDLLQVEKLMKLKGMRVQRYFQFFKVSAIA